MSKNHFDYCYNLSLTEKDICEITGYENLSFLRYKDKGYFPEPVYQLSVKTPVGGLALENHFDTDEVLIWCEDRYEEILLRLGGLIDSGKYRTKNPDLVKKQYEYLSSKPFSGFHWKGQLLWNKPSKWIANEMLVHP